MHKDHNEGKRRHSFSFWKLTTIAGLISVGVYYGSGNTSIAELLLLIVVVVGTVKLFIFALRVGSVLLKTIAMAILLLAWIGLFYK